MIQRPRDFLSAPLAQMPITIGPEQAVAHASWTNALAVVLAEVLCGPCVIHVVGSAGTGKTLLLQMLAQLLHRSNIDAKLQLRGDGGVLDGIAITEAARSYRAVLVDEAERLGADILGGIKSDRFEACSWVLASVTEPAPIAGTDTGKPKTSIVRLGALTASELRNFVTMRLARAGLSGDLMTDAALAEIMRRSAGVPRIVNMLLSASLFLAHTDASPLVDREHVEGAAALRNIDAVVDTPGDEADAAAVSIAMRGAFSDQAGLLRSLIGVQAGEPASVAQGGQAEEPLRAPNPADGPDDHVERASGSAAKPVGEAGTNPVAHELRRRSSTEGQDSAEGPVDLGPWAADPGEPAQGSLDAVPVPVFARRRLQVSSARRRDRGERSWGGAAALMIAVAFVAAGGAYYAMISGAIGMPSAAPAIGFARKIVSDLLNRTMGPSSDARSPMPRAGFSENPLPPVIQPPWATPVALPSQSSDSPLQTAPPLPDRQKLSEAAPQTPIGGLISGAAARAADTGTKVAAAQFITVPPLPPVAQSRAAGSKPATVLPALELARSVGVTVQPADDPTVMAVAAPALVRSAPPEKIIVARNAAAETPTPKSAQAEAGTKLPSLAAFEAPPTTRHWGLFASSGRSAMLSLGMSVPPGGFDSLSPVSQGPAPQRHLKPVQHRQATRPPQP